MEPPEVVAVVVGSAVVDDSGNGTKIPEVVDVFTDDD